ncbi:DUF4238 domain-containing protein [Candidatus Kuenenia sp.]|uniref:DUF4238 domain-containing protein n=1 Tax=Candidatus Kuenenia sp. TaxID=2499824 RepID=UPI00322042BD
MSGQRQHYIPRFLLKNFKSKGSKQQSFAWVFRANAEPYETNIENIAVEKYFYTEINSTNADGLITEAENRFACLVNVLLSSPLGRITNKDIPEFLAHLEIRTRHSRESFLRIGNHLINSLFMDIGKLKTFILSKILTDPSILKKSIHDKCHLPEFIVEIFYKFIVANPQLLEATLENMFPALCENILKESTQAVTNGVKEGHLRALNESIAPKGRIEKYKLFSYYTELFDNGDLILGDCALVFAVDLERKFKPFSDKGDKINAVILPLSNDRFLIGNTSGYTIDKSMLKEAIAACSLEYFIGKHDSNENRILKEKIGENSYLLTMEQLSEIAMRGLQ